MRPVVVQGDVTSAPVVRWRSSWGQQWKVRLSDDAASFDSWLPSLKSSVSLDVWCSCRRTPWRRSLCLDLTCSQTGCSRTVHTLKFLDFELTWMKAAFSPQNRINFQEITCPKTQGLCLWRRLERPCAVKIVLI